MLKLIPFLLLFTLNSFAATEVFRGNFSAKTDAHKDILLNDLIAAKDILQTFLNQAKTGCFLRGFETKFGKSSWLGEYRYDTSLRIYCDKPTISDVNLGYFLTGPDSYDLGVYVKFRDVKNKAIYFYEIYLSENGRVYNNKLSLNDTKASMLGRPRLD